MREQGNPDRALHWDNLRMQLRGGKAWNLNCHFVNQRRIKNSPISPICCFFKSWFLSESILLKIILPVLFQSSLPLKAAWWIPCSLTPSQTLASPFRYLAPKTVSQIVRLPYQPEWVSSRVTQIHTGGKKVCLWPHPHPLCQTYFKRNFLLKQKNNKQTNKCQQLYTRFNVYI